MIHKGILAAAGTVILAGSSYGGYTVIREQRVNRNDVGVQVETRSQVQQTVGKPSDPDVRGNRPEEAGDGVPVGESGERADISGIVSAIGDGYADVATFSGAGTGPGTGSGAGRGGRGAAVSADAPTPETGETVRIVLLDSTEYLVSAGGPDTEQAGATLADLEEGVTVSVWLEADDDDTMKAAERIVIRDGAAPLR